MSHLGPTDEIDDAHDHQDRNECSKADVHGFQLSWVTEIATHRIRQRTLRSQSPVHPGDFADPL